jgi:polysaccharide biosynthesis protein PslH
VNVPRPRLAFVSPSFLFPNDTGGRIRTTNVLRGLKDGAFEVTLIGPANAQEQLEWSRQLRTVCDSFVAWKPKSHRQRWQRALDLLDALPVNVVADRTVSGVQTVRRSLAQGRFDVVVFDFVHAAVLRPDGMDGATVCFTHNVEAEIFARHAEQASNPLMRRIWKSQHAKMRRFEREALRGFTSVVAVSERDGAQLRSQCGLSSVATIPTGVDLDFFGYAPGPPVDSRHPPTVVFTGSMDWDANVDGVRHFLAEAWPLIRAERPEAQFIIVGRKPPAALVEQAKALRGVRCTGFVDDVRLYVQAAHAFVIPLRVGGGTRIKAFEAMAMGCPVVSTSIGIEGLDVAPDRHFLLCDDAPAQARAILTLFRDAALRQELAQRARECVENRFGHRVAAQAFERVCLQALQVHRSGHSDTVPTMLAEPA